MSSIILDTNAYTAFKAGDAGAIDLLQRFDFILMCSIVIGELLAGFSVGSRTAQNRHELQQFLHSPRIRMGAVDDVTADFYATIYHDLRSKGRPIPTNDMWIAAIALQHESALFTYDAHFQQIQTLQSGSTAELLQL